MFDALSESCRGTRAAEIEVREFFELEDFEEGPGIDRFRELGLIDTIATAIIQSRPDLSTATAPNGTVTILFTDTEGSTQLTEELGDENWLTVLRAHNEVVHNQVKDHSGFEVKSPGRRVHARLPLGKGRLSMRHRDPAGPGRQRTERRRSESPHRSTPGNRFVMPMTSTGRQ